MGTRRTYRVEMLQGEEPEWGPLLGTVGERVTRDFMWMFEVKLSNGKQLHAYKHIDTRCYVHLDHAGEAFVYLEPGRYRSFPVIEVLAAVFAPLTGLRGVTREQIRTSWEAVDRLSHDGLATNEANRFTEYRVSLSLPAMGRAGFEPATYGL